MKKVQLFLLGMLLSSSFTFAQRLNDFKYDMAGLEFDLRKVMTFMEKNPKRFENPEYLVDFGQKNLQYYNRMTEQLTFGDPPDQYKTDLLEPDKIETVEINGDQYKKYSYQYLDIFYNMDNQLKYWETHLAYPWVLDTMTTLLTTANSMHIRDLEIKQKLKTYLQRTRNCLELYAYANNYVKKYNEAYHYMRNALRVMQSLAIDSTAYSAALFNAGYFAFQGNEYATAEKTFLEAIDYKFKEPEKSRGAIYQLLAECARKQENKNGAFEYAKMGVAAYPDLIDLIYEVINGYMGENDNENALKFMNQALALQPENEAVLILKASLIEEGGQLDEAIELFEQVLKVNPDNYKAHNHIAVIKYQRGRDALKAAMEEEDNKVYKQKVKEACLMFYECLEPLERCVELEPDVVTNAETLRSVYATIKGELKEEHPELEAKFTALDAKLKAAGNQ